MKNNRENRNKRKANDIDESKTETAEKKTGRKRTVRQAMAMAGVIILVLLYVVTLLTALLDNSASAVWFRLSLFATFALPLILWIYSWMYGRLTGKPAAGDPEHPDQDS